MNRITTPLKCLMTLMSKVHAARAVLLVLPVLSAGCAGISFTSLPDELADSRAKGFRYYDSSLYLLVQTDNQGGLTSSVVSMPDTTKLRQVRPYKFLAKNNANFIFSKGVLTDGNNTGDGTAVPNAFISALETAASAALKSTAWDDPLATKKTPQPPKSPQRTVPQVYLLKIEKIDGEWTLVGTEGSPLKF